MNWLNPPACEAMGELSAGRRDTVNHQVDGVGSDVAKLGLELGLDKIPEPIAAHLTSSLSTLVVKSIEADDAVSAGLEEWSDPEALSLTWEVFSGLGKRALATPGWEGFLIGQNPDARPYIHGALAGVFSVNGALCSSTDAWRDGRNGPALRGVRAVTSRVLRGMFWIVQQREWEAEQFRNFDAQF